MKKPELKLGRPVLAWDNDKPVPAAYVGAAEYLQGIQYQVVEEGEAEVSEYKHVKPDLEGAPMNGDKVEVVIDHTCRDWAIYIGLASDGESHVVEIDGKHLVVNHVRHPQATKRKRVRDAIKSWSEWKLPVYDDITDEILKITEEE